MKVESNRVLTYLLKAVSRISQALVQNTWYTVLSTVVNAKIYWVVFYQYTANEDIELKITDDVGSETITQTAVAGTTYHVIQNHTGDNSNRYALVSSALTNRSCLIESRSFKVEIRKTTAAGANLTMCKVGYGVM